MTEIAVTPVLLLLGSVALIVTGVVVLSVVVVVKEGSVGLLNVAKLARVFFPRERGGSLSAVRRLVKPPRALGSTDAQAVNSKSEESVGGQSSDT
ncbi:MAG: hypothetical protein LBR33_09225 [Propionibacteriaceae bacterium]|jgi:hypothetical protein|nr:hypothetical protein [Propionibacteriaceae bacterium]